MRSTRRAGLALESPSGRGPSSLWASDSAMELGQESQWVGESLLG